MSLRPNMQPTYNDLKYFYDQYRTQSNPCRRGGRDQCGFRMSLALVRSGFSLDTYPHRALLHHNPERCGTPFPHIGGAQSLALHLSRVWGPARLYSGDRLGRAREELTSINGVIFFKDCFVRTRDRNQTPDGETPPQRGDHIDLWTGSMYFNQIIHAPIGGNAGSDAPMFSMASEVWFWKL